MLTSKSHAFELSLMNGSVDVKINRSREVSGNYTNRELQHLSVGLGFGSEHITLHPQCQHSADPMSVRNVNK